MLKTLYNPFIFESPVTGPHFIGREREVNMVLDRISNHARGSIALTGERRIGKTSLLHMIASVDMSSRWNDAAKPVFVYLDCGSIPRFSMSQFWQAVLRKLDHQLKRIPDSESLRSTIAKLVSGSDIVTQDIELLLDDLNEAGLVWVLSLDEFEWLIRLDAENASVTRDLLGGLRALINHVPRVLSLIVATRQPLPELCRDIPFMGSPFYNSFVFVHLRKFLPAEAERLLALRLEGTSIVFTAEDRVFSHTLGGLHPVLLQAAAFCLFNAKADGGKVELNGIREQFASLVVHQFEDLWHCSAPREKLLLLALALDDPGVLGWLARWAHERESLALRGLVEEAENQGLRLFSQVWDDSLIAAGEDWEAHIGQAMARAQVAIFLISADALNSAFIRSKEIPELLRRRQEEGLQLVPVLVRPCAWKTVEWLRKAQVRPLEGKPLSCDADRFLDDYLAALTEEVVRLLQL